jgi:hypothetical protein
MREAAILIFTFAALAFMVARPHQFAPLPTRPMPAINVP